MMKRLFDVVLSAVALVVLAPLFLAIAVWVRLDSRGPVFFRQIRVGRLGCTFRIHKFRTMVVDAEKIGPALTVGSDPRVTRSGTLLRRYKLDELPQLIDVLRGDMSLVGPRPELPQYVALYPPRQRERVLSIRPGITDPASLEFLRESEVLAAAVDPERAYRDQILPRKLQIYVEYAEAASFCGDLRILLRTVGAILTR